MELTLEEAKKLGELRSKHLSWMGRGFKDEELVQALGEAIALLDQIVSRHEGPA